MDDDKEAAAFLDRELAFSLVSKCMRLDEGDDDELVVVAAAAVANADGDDSDGEDDGKP